MRRSQGGAPAQHVQPLAWFGILADGQVQASTLGRRHRRYEAECRFSPRQPAIEPTSGDRHLPNLPIVPTRFMA